ncbi:MAG: iron chelate uptake ABC transporter family permease subunit, partial [Bacteroidota bacterium]
MGWLRRPGESRPSGNDAETEGGTRQDGTARPAGLNEPTSAPRRIHTTTGTLRLGVGLALALLVSVAASVLFGSVDLGPERVWTALLGDGPEADRTIVWSLRMPRVVLALAVGGGLAVVGVAMQALVRNPLAEPYILGASSGASAGASLFFLGFLPAVVSKNASMSVVAVAGAWIAVAAVFAVARRGPTLSTARLLLAGVAMSALLGSVTAFVTYASPEPDKLRAVLFWLLGSLTRASWATVWGPAAASVGALAMLWLLARPLDLLSTGEEPAAGPRGAGEGRKRARLAHTAGAPGG